MVCLGVRSGQDPADSWPWSWEDFLASLAFQGVVEGKGGAYLGQGEGRTPRPSLEYPSPSFSKMVVPPTAPPSLGRKTDGASLPPPGELFLNLKVVGGRGGALQGGIWVG